MSMSTSRRSWRVFAIPSSLKCTRRPVVCVVECRVVECLLMECQVVLAVVQPLKRWTKLSAFSFVSHLYLLFDPFSI
ncbi:unnamed protein product [Hymenolepis diminuta]|uniref:Secreted protein n=1 Tax=Hymenolepis diminuta TaxID=6216 RepID=A0A0R3SHM1_HYMDI|nr:unnamed protein product [Hymenolepis diminuta]